MARRSTALDMQKNPRYTGVDPTTGQKRDSPEPLTAEQLERAQRIVDELQKKVQTEESRLQRIRDPHQRAVSADYQVQYAALLYDKAREVRNYAIYEDVTDLPRGQRVERIQELADELFLTTGRIRQIVSDVEADLREQGVLEEKRRTNLREKLTEDFLRHAYIEQGKTTVDIAQEVGCNPQTVANYLDKYGIDRRKRGEIARRGDDSGDGAARKRTSARKAASKKPQKAAKRKPRRPARYASRADRDRAVVDAYQEPDATLASVAREFDLSRERVRQIVRRAEQEAASA